MHMPMVNVRQMAVTVNRIFVGMFMTMLTANRWMIRMKMVCIIVVMTMIVGLLKMDVIMFMIFG